MEKKHGANLELALMQANSYVGGTITSNKIDKWKTVEGLGAGGIFEGDCEITIFGDTYDISYKSPTDGVVLYTFKKRQKPEYDLVPQAEISYVPVIPLAFVSVGQLVGGIPSPGSPYPWHQQIN